LQQALNSRSAPGVSDLILNPDAHAGYGAPVGCVLISPTHIYPGPVGVDIKCSMSLLQLDLPAAAIAERPLRRAIINAIAERTPTGAGKGQRSVKKSRQISPVLGREVAINGATTAVCQALGIPAHWATRCEDALHAGHDDTAEALGQRLELLMAQGKFPKFDEKVRQPLPKCSACAMGMWRFSRTAVRAVSATISRAGNSKRWKKNSALGTFRFRAAIANWFMRRSARPRPTRISTIWRSAEISPR
jgi:hypothetical protein